MAAHAQALQPYRDTAVSESEHIEEEFDDLIKVLDLEAPFTFHIGLDVQGELSWKAPYREIEVHAMACMHPVLTRHPMRLCSSSAGLRVRRTALGVFGGSLRPESSRRVARPAA